MNEFEANNFVEYVATDYVAYEANNTINVAFYQPTYVLTIQGENGNTLATILANGAVVMDESNANAAAKIFWQAIHFSRPKCPHCNGELQLV